MTMLLALRSGSRVFSVKNRLIVVYSVLAFVNIGAWLWAMVGFHGNPALLSIALVVYGLGLRHAVDADHIAAIDNVTRKLVQSGQRPLSVGFYFAMGHSTVVTLVAAAVAGAAITLEKIQSFRLAGAVVSTSVSVAFLVAIAVMNITILLSIYRTYRAVKAGRAWTEEDLDILLANRGILARMFGPLFRFVSRSWHMFPIGFLFGLGFDTATEVAMFGFSATQAAKGVTFTATLAFPLLFAAGMSLVDTTDGVAMLGAYRWAFMKPLRRLYYNLIITFIAVIVALFVASIEGLSLLGSGFGFSGDFWRLTDTLAGNFNALGFAVVGLFLVAWAASYLLYRFRKSSMDETHASISS
jgi:high-affinity nickel-transport protein